NIGDPAQPNHVALMFDVQDSLVDLLSGRPADLARLDIDYNFLNVNKHVTLLPDTVIASFFGIINVTAGIDLVGAASMGVHVTLGLDTKGFYVLDDGPDKKVLRMAGSAGADLNIKGKLTVIDFAQVTGEALIQATGDVDVVSATPGNPRVYTSDL